MKKPLHIVERIIRGGLVLMIAIYGFFYAIDYFGLTQGFNKLTGLDQIKVEKKVDVSDNLGYNIINNATYEQKQCILKNKAVQQYSLKVRAIKCGVRGI